jgi:hypothetical protein
MKSLEQQLKELKKQLGDEIAVKIISKKNKFKIVQVVTKSEDDEDYGDNIPQDIKPKTLKEFKKSLIETKNYIG